MRRFAFEAAVGLFVVLSCVVVIDVALLAPKLALA